MSGPGGGRVRPIGHNDPQAKGGAGVVERAIKAAEAWLRGFRWCQDVKRAFWGTIAYPSRALGR